MKNHEIIILGALLTLVAVGFYFAYRGNCTKFKGPLGVEVDVNC